jgi:hypothetical protein
MNPFNFQHFNASRVALIVDGKEVDKAFELDYDKDIYTRAYHSLFTAISGDIGDHDPSRYYKGRLLKCKLFVCIRFISRFM